MKKMLVVDGNSILNRAFYGIRLLTNRDGLYTNAVYGMVTIISRHLETLSPNYCAVAFDLKAPTFRHVLYDGYKANRKGMPEELAVQLPYAKECMKKMGLSVVTCEGYEADDILGTLARSMGDEETHVYLLTGDRDSLQLIDEHISVLLVKTKETMLFDPQEFMNQYGIPSSEFVDVKALMGDSSDNIPGVAGIGEKTALKLIAEYHSIEAVYESLASAALSEGIKKKLEAGKDMAFLSKKLAEICCKAPISVQKEEYVYMGPHAAALKKLFIKLEFSALIKKMGLDQCDDETGESNDKQASHATTELQKKAVEASSFSELIGERLYLSLKDSTLSMLCDQKSYQAALDTVSWEELHAFLKEKKLICHDSKSLYKELKFHGLELPPCFFDTMLAAYVLDSNRSNYSIGELYLRYVKEPMPQDMDETMAIRCLYEPLSREIEISGAQELLDRIELPLAYVLADMEATGFQIDSKGIQSYGEALNEAAQILQMRIYSYAGEEFNIGSPKQLGEILFEKMGLPKSRKTKTGYSTDAEALQKLLSKHPIIEDILEYRQVTKLKSTYADGLVKAADPFGRVHSILNQTGTATGRLSSSEPNLQNIPIKTELGREFRKFFIPKSDEYVLIDADYSQIELRLLAHIADDDAMIHAFLAKEDIHTMTASKVFNLPLNMVTSDLRKKAKAVNFGILYGIGEYSLSEDLGISRTQAKEYIESYFEQFPKIKEYLTRVQEEAKRDGYVTTFFGRRRYIPELASSNKNLQHFGERVAMNSPIQGTAADIIKIAMIRIHHILKEKQLDAELIMQVHDELILEAHVSCAEEVKTLLIDSMEKAASLSVPLSVEAMIGRTWFEAK
ncbi:MAG: DNA polymerase I [Ruminococcaceae bacterium]|nr:DNA polymerase I [Oscillospiraceae bacterium]